jgi:hypothetical protein
VTADAIDSRGQVEYAYGLGLVDPVSYKAALETCEVRLDMSTIFVESWA